MPRVLALIAGLAVLAALTVAGVDRTPPTVFERTERLADEIRCPVCDGVSVADSPSSTARAMWDDIADRVQRGQTDAEIREAFVERYGSWIVLTPTRRGAGGLALTLPALVTVAAALTVMLRRPADIGPSTSQPTGGP